MTLRTQKAWEEESLQDWCSS